MVRPTSSNWEHWRTIAPDGSGRSSFPPPRRSNPKCFRCPLYLISILILGKEDSIMGRTSTTAKPAAGQKRDADTKRAQSRLSVLELAKELGNVAEACS